MATAGRWLISAVRVVLVAAVAAAVSALAVYGVEQLLEEVIDGSTAVLVVMPALGLVANAIIRHFGGPRASPASVDSYIDVYHGTSLSVRKTVSRGVGSAATVGLGAAMDTSGLAALIGSLVADLVRRFFRVTGPQLLVVGVSAGFAVALRSPVAAAFLAIEVPFRSGANWRRLPYALAGSIAGWIAIGIVDSNHQPFRTDITVVGVRDVLVAMALAVIAGFASRIVARVANRAQRGIGPVFGREWHHVFTGAALLAGLAAISLAAFDDVPVSLGPGPTALAWAATTSVAGLCALLAIRVAASGASVLGRGTGGLFIPLLVMGMIAGHAVGDFFNGNVTLLSLIGAATLLAAGHRVPLAALVWLGEVTHSIPTILLGGVAILIAASVGGGHSVSTAQRSFPRRRPEFTH